MPVSWRIEEPLVLVTSDGAGGYEEWAAAVDTAIASPRFRPGMAVVHDLRAMTRVPTAQEARMRVNFLADRVRSGRITRWATIVRGAVHFGMARMAEAFSDSEGIEFRVFTEETEAMSWAQAASDQGRERRGV